MTIPPASVILISVDTLRADHLSCYGYEALATPHIDSLAHGGTIFSEVSSQVPITLPSHVSLFTSTYPFMTGIEENGEVLPSGAITLATVLKSHGYRTAAFIGGYFLARRFGFDQGFDLYDSPFDSRRFERALDLKRPAAEVTKSAERWMAANSDQPFFAFVHLFDLHQPYDPPRFERLAPKSDYDAELAYVDDVLGGFFRFLAQKGIDRRALVVLLSDHGESLGEHGEHTHGYFIYQSTLHVPVIIHWPAEGRGFSPAGQTQSRRIIEARFSAGLEAPPFFGRSPKPGIAGTAASAIFPSRVDSPAGLIDVAPTILQALGIPEPSSFAGRSLMPLLQGEVSSGREVYSESTYAHDKFGWASLHGVRMGNYHYIEAPKPELYNVAEDRGETRNLYSSHESLAHSYSDRLAALRARYRVQAAAGASPVSPEILERLRSLGYLAVASPKSESSSGADPKDHVVEYNRYLEALHLAQTGKPGDAAALFEKITSEDPENTPAHFELATCDMSLRRYQEAVGELKAVLAALPRDVEAAETLGTLWLQLGQEERARTEFQALLSIAPGDFTAEYGLGTIAARERHFDEAIKHFRAALAARPESAGTHYNLGLALETVGRNQEAKQEFGEALKDDPDFVAAQTALDRLESN
ncbi:MAG TPA: sulfatase-like hydrolase/transferase [Terriglobia bacterium]|nr:sulfatase-like hydrolase/transferase [Terriglobia bacterium]